MIFSKFSNLENELLAKPDEYDVENTTSIGDFYYRKENYNRAEEWYKIGAKKLHGRSCYSLGLIYRYHKLIKTKKTRAKALHWFNEAFRNGYKEAAYEIGYMFELDIVGEYSGNRYDIAFEWYLKAGDEGQPDALYRIGVFYEKGLGIPANRQTALTYYHRSAFYGHEEARKSIYRLSCDSCVKTAPEIELIKAEEDKKYMNKIQSRLEYIDEIMSTRYDEHIKP